MENKTYKYSCEQCNYFSNRLSNYNKHLSTRKHQNCYFLNKKEQKVATNEFICDNCGKIYKVRNSLWYHKKNCGVKNEKISLNNKEVPLNSKQEKLEKENAELKQMIFTVMDKMSEQQKTIQELVPKVGNNNNNQFNVNVFLNEKCKDALNINDFVNTIQIGINDLDFATNKGLIEGVSTILAKNLNNMEIEKRPIHCTDVNKKTLYIKDSNQWNKDNEEIVKNTIQNVKDKHIEAMHKWENENPDWRENNKKTENYMELIKKSTGILDEKDRNHILSVVSKETEIK